MPSQPLGAVRLRPKANKPSVNNFSASNGHVPYGAAMPFNGGAPGDLDFLSRVEQAEARDSARQQDSARRRTGAKGHQAYVKRHHDGGLMDTGGVVFGGDNTPRAQRQPAGNMYTTSNSATNQQMQQMHAAAVQKHQEDTIRKLLMEQHGLSKREAEEELKLWRQEVANGKAAPLPSGDEPTSSIDQRRGKRGENGQFLTTGSFEDPFKVRAVRSATPPKPKPWDVEPNPFKQSHTPAAPKVAAWDVNDPFKQRSPPQQCAQQHHMEMRAAGGAARNPAAGMGMRDANSHFHMDPNASSISGGIFG